MMAKSKQKAPGKHYRKGMTLVEAVQRFSDEAEVEQMFIDARWPKGVTCPNPDCGSNNIQHRANRKPAPFRCRACRKDFSVKTGTVMESSKLQLSKWALTAYLMSTNLKGIAALHLHRDIGVSYPTAWFLEHRVREALGLEPSPFDGPVEVDEVYIGGLEKNKHTSKKLKAGRGTVGKTPVVGAKDRATNQVVMAPVASTDKETLTGFIEAHVKPGAAIYTDEHAGYNGLPNHETVAHSAGEYVRGDVHTNGIEGQWSLFRRGIYGTFHHISPKHTGRYAKEFAGRRNIREFDTETQIRTIIAQMVGKRLKWKDLIANPTPLPAA